MDWASAILGGVVGGLAASFVAGLFALRAQSIRNAHERDMAREARLQDRRAETYERIISHALGVAMATDRAEPMFTIGPPPPPPEPIPDAELIALESVTRAHASAAMIDRLRRFTEALQPASAAILAIRMNRDRPGSIPDREGWPALLEARTAIRTRLDELAEQANRELASVD